MKNIVNVVELKFAEYVVILPRINRVEQSSIYCKYVRRHCQIYTNKFINLFGINHRKDKITVQSKTYFYQIVIWKLYLLEIFPLSSLVLQKIQRSFELLIKHILRSHLSKWRRT